MCSEKKNFLFFKALSTVLLVVFIMKKFFLKCDIKINILFKLKNDKLRGLYIIVTHIVVKTLAPSFQTLSNQ